jgi:hypothetical protein
VPVQGEGWSTLEVALYGTPAWICNSESICNAHCAPADAWQWICSEDQAFYNGLIIMPDLVPAVDGALLGPGESNKGKGLWQILPFDLQAHLINMQTCDACNQLHNCFIK